MIFHTDVEAREFDLIDKIVGHVSFLQAVTGSECVFAQELVGVNSTSQHCCFLGDMTKKVIVVPCLDEFLETGSNKQQK